MRKRLVFFLPLLCLVLSAVFIVASLGSGASVGFPLQPGELETLNDGWTLSVNGEDKGPFQPPGYTGAAAGDVVALEHAMPERDLTRVYLALRTSQMYVKAYIDGELVYSYGDRGALPYGRAPGASWNLIELSGGGERIRLEFSCDYDSRASSLGSILIGTRYSLFYSLLQIHYIPFLISLVTMFCGICLALIGLSLNRARRSEALFHLGMFCVSASVWCLMECNALDLLFPRPFLITQLGDLCLMLSPIPMLLFLRSFFELEDERLCDALLIGGCGVFAGAVILQLAGVLDLFITVSAGYCVIILYSVYFFSVMVRKRGQLDRIGAALFRTAVAVIALFTLADLVTYSLFLRELVPDSQDYAFFFRIGFLFFILLLAAVSIRQIFLGYRRGVESGVLQRMLETDMMTGLFSRHTFDLAMEELRLSPPGQSLAMVLFDLNNLKQINDTLGHKKGDDLIKATAALMREIFSAHGRCYRIGGDELIAILPNIDHALLEQRINEFQAAAAARSQSDGIVIDTAVGYGFFSPGMDADISALFTRVDDAMYRNKRLKKQSAGTGRATETTGRRSTDMHE